jgi:hypothetical protein
MGGPIRIQRVFHGGHTTTEEKDLGLVNFSANKDNFYAKKASRHKQLSQKKCVEGLLPDWNHPKKKLKEKANLRVLSFS